MSGNACKIKINSRGFTYISALILVTIAGIALTAASMYWSTVVKREKEMELLFCGDQIQKAIKSYCLSTPGGLSPAYPVSFDDLLRDGRYPVVKRHLRKSYGDPVTENGEWGLIHDSKGNIKGIFSKSNKKPLKTENFPAGYEDFKNAEKYSEWKFVYVPE